MRGHEANTLCAHFVASHARTPASLVTYYLDTVQPPDAPTVPSRTLSNGRVRNKLCNNHERSRAEVVPALPCHLATSLTSCPTALQSHCRSTPPLNTEKHTPDVSQQHARKSVHLPLSW